MPLAPRSLTIFESFNAELDHDIAESRAENQAIRERIAQAQAQQQAAGPSQPRPPKRPVSTGASTRPQSRNEKRRSQDKGKGKAPALKTPPPAPPVVNTSTRPAIQAPTPTKPVEEPEWYRLPSLTETYIDAALHPERWGGRPPKPTDTLLADIVDRAVQDSSFAEKVKRAITGP